MSSEFHHVIDADLRSQPMSAPRHTVAAGLDQYLLKNPDFPAPISVLRENVAPLQSLELVGYDVVHLHGVSGALNQKDWASLNNARKVVWTLHDMNAFTGGCHYSLGCEGYTTGCSSCPAVRTFARSAISRNWKSKRDHVSSLNNLIVVSPSEWLAQHASRSEILREAPVIVQPNPINPAYCENPADNERDVGQLSVVVVAKNLDDDVKNVSEAVSAFHEARTRHPDLTLTLVGRGGHAIQGPGITLSGELNPSQLRDIFSRSDLLIVPSLAENSPLVIPEAAAQGVLPLVSNVGGMPELVSLLGHGSVFSSATELASALSATCAEDPDTRVNVRNALRNAALSHFSPRAVVNGYDKVYA